MTSKVVRALAFELESAIPVWCRKFSPVDPAGGNEYLTPDGKAARERWAWKDVKLTLGKQGCQFLTPWQP